MSVLQLRVWRPCRWEREYLDVNKQRPAEVTSFQECIYSWEPFSNLLDSITHIEQTETLREKLETFTPTYSPEKREIENLKGVLGRINQEACHCYQQLKRQDCVCREKPSRRRSHNLVSF